MFQYLRYKLDPTIAAIGTTMIVVSMALVVVDVCLLVPDRLMGLSNQ
ncbi:MAG: hypothetical protein MUO64_22445 [Anaerolineales bacterium]|nr:hypothetical protein [Anaerolineales bacterium]